MKRLLCLPVVAALLSACGGGTPEPQVAETTAPVVTAPAPTQTPEPEPTPEEKKKAEEAQKLQADRAALKLAHEKEQARWTPELRRSVTALIDKNYPNGKAALAAALKSAHRQPGNAERDAARHPAETLAFFGLAPNQTVLEYGPGGGWYTELLAPVVAKKGKLIVTNGDPKGPEDQRSTYYAQRVALLLESAPELYGKVETVVVDGKAPKLDLTDELDLAVVIRGMHGMVNAGTLGAWLEQVHTALKPKGVLGIVQHRAKSDADPKLASKQGYLPEAWVIEQVEAAGFKLAGKSEVNANPKDTKDYPEGVWALPPSLERGDKDRAALQAIGESDRMTLKFVKAAAKK